MILLRGTGQRRLISCDTYVQWNQTSLHEKNNNKKTAELILIKTESVYIFYLLAVFFFKVILNCNTVYSYDQFSRKILYVTKIRFI